MARREQHVAEDAVSFEREAAVDGADALDPVCAEALVPARPPTHVLDVLQEQLERRPVPVADAATSGTIDRRRRASRTARPGNEVGRQWPSLSERIVRWRIASACLRKVDAGS